VSSSPSGSGGDRRVGGAGVRGPGLHRGRPAEAAETHGIRLEVVKHTQASAASSCCRGGGWWNAPSRGSAFPTAGRDYERLPETLAGLHFVAFACLMLTRLFLVLGPRQVHNSL